MLPALVLGVFLQPCHAQVGTLKWQFKSRSEVGSALQKTRGSLRGTYEVMVSAARHGYQNSSLGFYEKLVVGHEFSASLHDSATYAFAYSLCDGIRPWNWKKDSDASAVKSSTAVTAEHFRQRAMTMGSGSAEVLIMQSFSELYGGSRGKRKLGYERAVKATKKAQNWADAYYWLATAANNYALAIELNSPSEEGRQAAREQRARLGKVALRAIAKAERLDAGLRPHLYMLSNSAYELTGGPNAEAKMLANYKAHVHAFPYYMNWYGRRFKLSEDEIWQQWRQQAADAAKQ